SQDIEDAVVLERPGRHATLLRAVEPVSRVTEPGHDEAALVQSTINGGAHDVHVGMVLVDELDAWRRCDDAHERYRLRAGRLHLVDRGRARMSGREHRVEDDRV